MRKLLVKCWGSGLTQAEFARQHGMTPGCLAWWKHEIRQRDKKRRKKADQVSLIPVEVSPSNGVEGSGGCIVIGGAFDYGVELSNGIRIHVPAQFERHALEQLVEVLRQC